MKMPTKINDRIRGMKLTYMRRPVPVQFHEEWKAHQELIEVVEQKLARRVRTPEGERRYGQPIGSIIVRDRPLKNLTLLESMFEGWDLVQGSNGKRYEVGQDEGKWIATEEGDTDWKPVATGTSLDDLYLKLDKVAGRAPKAAPADAGMREATDADRKRLVIPPAWTNVRVADSPTAPLQAVGTDAKGRKQYRYSKEHTEAQAAKKFERVGELAKQVELLDKALDRDVMENDDAAALLLMRKLAMRPGSNRDTGADKKAFGATTLQRRHVRVLASGKVKFKFDSKKGGVTQIESDDPLIREMIQARMDREPGEPLFNTTEAKTMAYMKEVAPDFKQKDLRTLVGSTLAAELVKGMPIPQNKTQYTKQRNEIGDIVAEVLQNTRTVSLSSYINPATFLQWQSAIGEG